MFTVKVHMALSKITARDQHLEHSVKMYFTRGVTELASVASCLLGAQKDTCVYAEVREHIKEASQQLSCAEDLAQKMLEKVDLAVLEMMAQKKKLMDEQKVLSENRSTLQDHLRNLEILERETMWNFIEESFEKLSAQVEQECAEARAEIERSARNAALWSMLIPIVGTIAGECF